MFLVCVIICNVLLHWGRNLTDWQGSESGIPVLPEAECHSLTQLVECSLLTWQLNPPELEYWPWQHHSPPQTKKEPEPSKGLDDESRWWTRTRLWSPGQVRFISERVPGLWDAQSLLFVLDFNEPGLAAVLLTMRPLLGLVVQGLETTVRPVAFEGLETTIRLGQTKILQWL